MKHLPGTYVELFRYNTWARDRLLAATADCTDATLDTPFEMGEGSLRKTISHLWGAEEVWLQRWEGVPVTVEDDELLSVAEVVTRFAATDARRDAWLSTRTAQSLEESFRYRRPQWMGEGPDLELHTGVSLLHVLNHGTHHRTQALNMLKRLGLTVPVLDYIREPIKTVPALDLPTLQRYLRHGDWGFRQVHQAAAPLSDEARNRDFPIGPGTVHRILRHLADAPAWWLDAIEHGPGSPFPSIETTDTWDALWTRYSDTVRRRDACLATLSDRDLPQPVTVLAAPGKTLSFPLGVVLLQLCIHGTHHRAQALNMLRHSGADVPMLDVAVWQREGAPVVS